MSTICSFRVAVLHHSALSTRVTRACVLSSIASPDTSAVEPTSSLNIFHCPRPDNQDLLRASKPALIVAEVQRHASSTTTMTQ